MFLDPFMHISYMSLYQKTVILKPSLFPHQEFLKKEFSDENIVFWIACENFRNLTEFEQVGCTGLTSMMTNVTIKSHGLNPPSCDHFSHHGT